MLTIHNSLTGQKEVFTPIEPNKVRMYVCGMTVYDYCHLGHARVLVVFDVVLRYLRSLGYDVTYVRNITDIDDKIIRRASESNISINELTARFIDAMHEDAKALGVLPPTSEPRATESLDQMISMIETLITKEYAYTAANGDVYYSVSHFADYGKLADRKLEDLRVGARVEIGEHKNDPLDFVLWKAAKPDEPSWPSPWGPGRPGWHIECSAMATHALGDHFDIHGGGMDLKFPHHENEIAQSEAATGHKYVNVWMHNGFVQIQDEKMSKSLGNFFTVREVLAQYQPEVVRYFILGSHYRGPLSYSTDNLQQARAALERLYTALRGIPVSTTPGTSKNLQAERFHAAMQDDFNVPEALAVLFELARDINRYKDEGNHNEATNSAAQLRHLANHLNILQADPEQFLKGIATKDGLSDEQIEYLIAQRIQARQQKRWADADKLRDQLTQAKIQLEDKGDVTLWRRG